MSQKIGLEVANGFIKVVSGEEELAYPNRLKQLTGLEFNVVGDLGAVYKYDDKEYILDPNGIGSGGRSSDRYLTKDYLLEMLIAISHVITDRNISMTIGVPCRDFENVELKNKMHKHLSGRHVLVKKVNGEESDFVINVSKLNILCEPLGTLCDFIFNDKLQIVNNRDKFTYVVIDIGYSTTDILVTNGLQVIKLTGADIGCMDIINSFVRQINNSISKDTDYHFTNSDITEDISPIIEKYGKTFDFTEELDLIKEAFAKELDSKIRDTGINLAHYDRIIYSGGGAIALKDHIDLRKNAIIYPDSQIANARGFYKFSLIKE